MILWLSLQAVVGLVWAFLMFRTLFRLRADAVDASGRMFPGLGATLGSFRGFLTLPRYARDRRLLGGATLLLVGLSAGFSLIRP